MQPLQRSASLNTDQKCIFFERELTPPATRRAVSNLIPRGMDAHVCHEGWLMKKTRLWKKWRRRYFVLTAARLEYKATPEGQVLGCITLDDDRKISVERVSSDGLVIAICSGKRRIEVSALDKGAILQWVDAISNRELQTLKARTLEEQKNNRSSSWSSYADLDNDELSECGTPRKDMGSQQSVSGASENQAMPNQYMVLVKAGGCITCVLLCLQAVSVEDMPTAVQPMFQIAQSELLWKFLATFLVLTGYTIFLLGKNKADTGSELLMSSPRVVEISNLGPSSSSPQKRKSGPKVGRTPPSAELPGGRLMSPRSAVAKSKGMSEEDRRAWMCRLKSCFPQEADATEFKVRGKNYCDKETKGYKKKVLSASAVGTLLRPAMLYRMPFLGQRGGDPDHVYEHLMRLPSVYGQVETAIDALMASKQNEDGGGAGGGSLRMPFLYAINLMVPAASDLLLSIFMVWMIPHEEDQARIDGEKLPGGAQGGAEEPEEEAAARERFYRLFRKFVDWGDDGDGGDNSRLGAFDTEEEQAAFRNERFKLIPRLSEGPWILKQTVPQKPALLGQKLQQRYYRGGGTNTGTSTAGSVPAAGGTAGGGEDGVVSEDESEEPGQRGFEGCRYPYLEVSVDIGSSVIADTIVRQCTAVTKELTTDMAITQEGCCAAELPERIIGTITMAKVNLRDCNVPPDLDLLVAAGAGEDMTGKGRATSRGNGEERNESRGSGGARGAGGASKGSVGCESQPSELP
jgi:hypothetical protein